MIGKRRVHAASGLLAGLSLLGAGCGKAANPYSIASQRTGQARMASAAVASNLIVKLKAQAGSDDLAQTVGARTLSSFPQLGMVVLGLPAGVSHSRAMASLAGNPAVQYAEPDFRMRSRVPAADPDVSRQWGHQAIDVRGAWDLGVRGDERVVVAVVDTGVDLDHPDLRGRLEKGRTFVAGSSSPMDDNGHGTHVAGVIGAELNGFGVTGVAPFCKLMPVKVLDAKGEGNTSDIVAGLLYAADSGARIINLSLGGGSGSKALEEAIKYAHGKGSLVVAAMGNDGRNLQEFPAAYAGVISVGAIANSGSSGAFSPATFSNNGTWISVSAPGDGIYSTMPTYESTLAMESPGAGVGYGYLSGTSMATPYVSGVAALVASLYPKLPPAEIKARIERTALDQGPAGFDTFFGYGLVNARCALAGCNPAKVGPALSLR